MCYIGSDDAYVKAKTLFQSLNSNDGDAHQREYRIYVLDCVTELIKKRDIDDSSIFDDLKALLIMTNESARHQLLRNSCIPLGYILVFFCGNLIPDPPSESTNPSNVI